MNEAGILLSLLRLPDVGPVRLRIILSRLSQMGIPPERIYELSEDRLMSDLHLSPEQIQALQCSNRDPEEDLRQYGEMEIEILLPSDRRYPWNVLNLLGRSAPLLLFAKGNLELLQKPALGVSGSRKASERSLAAITELCEAVASEGWVVASGGARGTDEAAHLAAVRRGPGTIVVLPTGVLRPNLRKELTKHFEAGKGLIISEFLPEQGWTTGCAMQRNRILVTLSKGVVLVEPGLQGGTGGTGKIAQKLGVPLYILDSHKRKGEAIDGFLSNGARLLASEGMKARELTHMLQRAWEESALNEINKKSQTHMHL